MAGYYEALPIYKAATDLVVVLDRVVRGFSRYHKYTLGSRLRDAAIEVTLMIARANRREDRAALLPGLCGLVEDLKLLVNLGKEVQAFASFSQFAQVMEQVVGVARQAEGWRKSVARQMGPRPDGADGGPMPHGPRGPEPKRPAREGRP